MRFFLGTPAGLELARVALDQANGYRDALGQPVRVMHKIVRQGVQVGEIASDVYCATHGFAPTTTVGAPIVGADGTAALELPQADDVDRHLGKTVRGFALPQARDLVDEGGLSGDCARVVDDMIVVTLPAEVVQGKLDARNEMTVEARTALLAMEARIGAARTRAAVQRRDGAQSRAALDAAMGLGRAR